MSLTSSVHKSLSWCTCLVNIELLVQTSVCLAVLRTAKCGPGYSKKKVGQLILSEILSNVVKKLEFRASID